LDARITGIEERFERTLEWVFELQEFTSWLQQGTGIFWIRGKPGSGKSTLMKFITQHPQTWDLVHDFQRGAREISASFFFHFRGSAMQKSFEGVLRSLLKQLLTELPALFALLQAVLPTKKDPAEPLKWTVSNLEGCLWAILEQCTADIDLCLFFDALDEFDGHHSLICNFLKGLVKVRPTSSTRVKVCFSSRPWDIFEANFGDCPGFKIQDHTEGDIRDFCLKSLSEITPDVPSIEELVPDIIARAVGVFLWVKLVFKQLANTVAKKEAVNLSDIQETVEALPTELGEFYDFILQRIPHSVRWQTYALLETLIRSNDKDHYETSTDSVFCTVLISDCSTHRQATNKLKALEQSSVSASIASWSGGLVEIVRPSTGLPQNVHEFAMSAMVNRSGGLAPPRVQLMHQTVHEFATSTKFKERVLRNRAKITYENGHTFRAKFNLVYMSLPPKHEEMGTAGKGLRYHMAAAEATTGRSLFNFLSDMPSKELPRMALALDAPKAIRSWLGIAANEGWQLCIRDITAKHASILRENREPLLECVLAGFDQAKCATAAFLLDNGYRLHEDVGDLWSALWRDLKLHSLADRTQHEELERDFGLVLMEHGWDMRRRMKTPGPSFAGFKEYGAIFARFKEDGPSRCTILHVAYPALTRCLLERGFDPNARDDQGNTPLNWILERVRYVIPTDSQLDKARLLVEAGGRPTGCDVPVDWDIALEILSPEQRSIWLRNGWTEQR